MHLRKDTANIQEMLGAYCRNGELVQLPGVRAERLHHYRRLVNNVVRDTLDSAFPVTLAALEENDWDALVQEFFAVGQPQSPQIWRLPFEFFQFHASRRTGIRINRPYLDDLLYFEWMEMEVYNMPDRIRPSYRSEGDLLVDPLAFNPDYEIVRLEYPIHLYPAEQSLQNRGAYFVLIYRAPDTGFVHFLNLSALNIHILQRLVDDDVPAMELRGEIARATGIESRRYLDEALETFLGDLMDKQFLLGFNSD